MYSNSDIIAYAGHCCDHCGALDSILLQEYEQTRFLGQGSCRTSETFMSLVSMEAGVPTGSQLW